MTTSTLVPQTVSTTISTQSPPARSRVPPSCRPRRLRASANTLDPRSRASSMRSQACTNRCPSHWRGASRVALAWKERPRSVPVRPAGSGRGKSVKNARIAHHSKNSPVAEIRPGRPPKINGLRRTIPHLATASKRLRRKPGRPATGTSNWASLHAATEPCMTEAVNLIEALLHRPHRVH